MKQDNDLRVFLKYNVYNTKKWKLKRKSILNKRNLTCDLCGKIITDKYNVHHKIELDYNNYLNNEIVFGDDNLMLLHIECHNIIHNKNFKKTIQLTNKSKIGVNYSVREHLLAEKRRKK